MPTSVDCSLSFVTWSARSSYSVFSVTVALTVTNISARVGELEALCPSRQSRPSLRDQTRTIGQSTSAPGVSSPAEPALQSNRDRLRSSFPTEVMLLHDAYGVQGVSRAQYYPPLSQLWGGNEGHGTFFGKVPCDIACQDTVL